jgi:hypothetical protein
MGHSITCHRFTGLRPQVHRPQDTSTQATDPKAYRSQATGLQVQRNLGIQSTHTQVKQYSGHKHMGLQIIGTWATYTAINKHAGQ